MSNYLQTVRKRIAKSALIQRTQSILKAIFSLLKETMAEWSRDNASQLGAALAYYTALSLAPLLVLVVVIFSLVFGNTSFEGEIINGTQKAIGQDAAIVIRTVLRNAGTSGSGIIATVISIGMLMFSASGVFGQLKRALNTVWELQQRSDRGVTGMIKERLISFAMVLVAGSLLIASLLFDTVLSVLGNAVGAWLPPALDPTRVFALLQTLQVAQFLLSFVIFSLLFAFIYKAVPDAEIAWSDVWIGGIATSLLFTTGNVLIGLYLGRSSVGSAYGAAGSLVALLVWVYYSAQVFFIGAEFTQVYANMYGSRILPDDDAVAVLRKTRTRKEVFAMMRPQFGGHREDQDTEEQESSAHIASATTSEHLTAAEDNPSEQLVSKKKLAAFSTISALVGGAVVGAIFGLRQRNQHQNDN
jgi:membrane protein